MFIRLTLLTSLSSLPINPSPSVLCLVFLHFRGKKKPLLDSLSPQLCSLGWTPSPTTESAPQGARVCKDSTDGIRSTLKKDSKEISLQMEAAEEKIWKEAYGSHLQSIWLPIPHSFKGSEVHSPTFYRERSPSFSPVLYNKSRKKLSLLYLD